MMMMIIRLIYPRRSITDLATYRVYIRLKCDADMIRRMTSFKLYLIILCLDIHRSYMEMRGHRVVIPLLYSLAGYLCKYGAYYAAYIHMLDILFS